MKLIARFFIYLFHLIYNYHTALYFKRKLDSIYSIWLSFEIEHARDVHFAYPIGALIGVKHISIGKNTAFGEHCILATWDKYESETFSPELTIGNHCDFGEYNHITACNKITIGDGVLTGRYVYIGDNAHGGLSWEEAPIPPAKRRLKSKGEIVIGNNVWIGDKVTILGGVTIGDNVIIGANSAVTHDVPSNSIALGMPAKVIRELGNR